MVVAQFRKTQRSNDDALRPGSDRKSPRAEPGLSHSRDKGGHHDWIGPRSETGVRLRCRSRTPFPDKVRLRAPRLGLDIMARTVWQTGFDTGLAFEM